MFRCDCSVVSLVTPSVPATDVLPVACATVKLPLPIFRLVPSNTKFASSSSSPLAPAITTRLSVRSLTLALANVAAVVALTFSAKKSLATPRPPSIITAPVVLLVESVVSLKLAIPVVSSVPPTVVLPEATTTRKVSLAAAPISKFVPSKRKFASSSSAPLVPAITIRLSVRSLTVALGAVSSLDVWLYVNPASPVITPALLYNTCVSPILPLYVPEPPEISILPLLNVSLAIPKPPSIITEPVVLLVDCVVSLKFAIPVESKVPPTVVLPLATTTVVVPALNVVPSIVRLVSSSRAPLAPAITIRLSVRSEIVALGAVSSLDVALYVNPASPDSVPLTEYTICVSPILLTKPPEPELMSMSPFASKLRIVAISLFASSTKALLAAAVPAVTPSSTPISASVIVVLPCTKLPPSVMFPVAFSALARNSASV